MVKSLLCALVILLSVYRLLLSEANSDTDGMNQIEAEMVRIREETWQLRITGHTTEAIIQQEKLLALSRKRFGSDHPTVANITGELADLYEEAGDKERAKQLRETLKVTQSRQDLSESEKKIKNLIDLSRLYFDMHHFTQAKETLDEAHRSLESEHFGPSVLFSVIANEYGRIEEYTGDSGAAERWYLLAYDMAETLGASFRAAPLQNVALLHAEVGKLELAENEFKRALEITEATSGKMNADYATTLHNLALTYSSQRNFSGAREACTKGMNIIQRAYAAGHPMLSHFYNCLASLAWQQGEITEALRLQNLSNENIAGYITRVVWYGSESEQLSFISQFFSQLNASIAISMTLSNDNIIAGEQAFKAVLQRKARILEVLSQTTANIREGLNSEEQRLAQELSLLRRKKAERRYALASPVQGTIADVTFEEGQRERRIQRSLSERISTKLDIKVSDIKDIVNALPKNSSLVEYIVYDPLIPGGKKPSGPPRYAAFVLQSSGKLDWFDLGEEAVINQGIHDLREALSNPKALYIKRAARRVDKLIMEPLRKIVGSSDHVLVCADGPINVVPFSALVDDSSTFLLEKHTFTYLTSARDVLKFRTNGKHGKGIFVVADVQYDTGPHLNNHGCLDGHTSTGQNQRKEFPQLCWTIDEADAIEQAAGAIVKMTGAGATESAVKAIKRPNILHLATHGFYLAADPIDDKSKEKRNPVARSVGAMLNSGVVLAGANARKSGNDDGILTALEIIDMDLTGTELVVLSACDTGQGEELPGEGVFGLRRALVMAGAKSQVMSLWKVPDRGTAKFMSLYYRFLLSGIERGIALRKAQQAILFGNAGSPTHPYFWAGFIASGDWRAISQ